MTLTKVFWIGKYPVTQRQWLAVMGGRPSDRFVFSGNMECPAENVTWDNICKSRGGFLADLNRLGLSGSDAFRLPTEAEWEYACRAGTTGNYNVNGAGIDDFAWYRDNSGGRTHPVGQKRANAWSVHDMHGNVWDWCSDRYGSYPEGSVIDPVGPNEGGRRVFRGGSWFVYARWCRSAFRFWSVSADFNGLLGFRLALSSGLGS